MVVFYLFGFIVEIFVGFVFIMIIGCFFMGVGVGVSIVIVFLYISEVVLLI